MLAGLRRRRRLPRSSALLAAFVVAGCARPWSDAGRSDGGEPGSSVAAPSSGESALIRLRAAGARVKPWQPSPSKGGAGGGKAAPQLVCAVEDGVVVLRGPTGVRYSRPPRLRGSFALKLARFEALAQEEAERTFGRKLVRIDHAGTYVCRPIAGSSVASQHAFGNAIDITSFVLRGGKTISVARHFVRGGQAAQSPEGSFLARVIERAWAERLFRTVLTPDFDSRHAGHLHLDDRPGGWWRAWSAT